jgi:hypothetical protein
LLVGGIMQPTARALDRFLRAVGDPIAEIRDIGPGHPEFVEATVLRAAAGVVAKTPDALPAVADALRAAEDLVAPAPARAHLDAARAWLDGDPLLAAERYASILSRWPHDVLALRLAQSCYFFLGRHAQLCEVVDEVWHAWQRDSYDFGFVLAMASFAHAENGDAAYAEALGREALKVNPACPIGVHAVAHAFAESGRNHLGAQWMRDQVAQWAGESRMRTHNAWHLAMFDADLGNVGSAVGILDTWLLPASVTSPLDACDAAALMWRLAGDGVEDEGRWRRISDAFAYATPGFWPYVDLHAGLAHLGAGQRTRAKQLVRQIDVLARGNGDAASRARRITRPGLQALAAWSENDYARAARLFAQIGPRVTDAGGSRIQLGIFKDLGAEAARRGRVAQRVEPHVLPLRVPILAKELS